MQVGNVHSSWCSQSRMRPSWSCKQNRDSSRYDIPESRLVVKNAIEGAPVYDVASMVAKAMVDGPWFWRHEIWGQIFPRQQCLNDSPCCWKCCRNVRAEICLENELIFWLKALDVAERFFKATTRGMTRHETSSRHEAWGQIFPRQQCLNESAAENVVELFVEKLVLKTTSFLGSRLVMWLKDSSKPWG